MDTPDGRRLPADPRGYTPEEVAALLPYSRQAGTIRRWCRDGIIEHLNLGTSQSGVYLIPSDVLDSLGTSPPTNWGMGKGFGRTRTTPHSGSGSDEPTGSRLQDASPQLVDPTRVAAVKTPPPSEHTLGIVPADTEAQDLNSAAESQELLTLRVAYERLSARVKELEDDLNTARSDLATWKQAAHGNYQASQGYAMSLQGFMTPGSIQALQPPEPA